jgi:hypothetical protein
MPDVTVQPDRSLLEVGVHEGGLLDLVDPELDLAAAPGGHEPGREGRPQQLVGFHGDPANARPGPIETSVISNG